MTAFDEIDAEQLDVSGVLTVERGVRVDIASFSGAVTAHGDLRCESVEVSGATEISGDATANHIAVSGSLSVDGVTRADEFECSGSVHLEDVKANQFEATGAVTLTTLDADAIRIQGAIEAEQVEANEIGFDLVSDSVISHLVGESVVVTRHRPNGFLRAEFIEGDDVALDYVDVGTVVGDQVSLGSNASVEVVRAEEIDVADGATVGSMERIE
ncbi:hypothetical protein GCM10009000_076330 [Halobacterium noricense]|uniref:Polymer-forming cytoskeletal protein n=1 Tax=Haladaptatus pallidirubidus TaxID=1008152 RepID=A0AAV3UMP7_9EURY